MPSAITAGTIAGGGSGGGTQSETSVLSMTQQTAGLSAGDPVRFTAISGDHSLSTYQVTVSGNRKGSLLAHVQALLSASTAYCTLQWYDVTGAAYIGAEVDLFRIDRSSTTTSPTCVCIAPISQSTDNAYELRIKAVPSGSINSIEATSTAIVESHG